MRQISLIGGGQAGLLLGFALLEKGYDVSLYTDRSAEQVSNSRLPSTPFLFDGSLQFERELGLNFWEAAAPWGEGMHVDFRNPDGSIAFTVQGHLGELRGQTIDQRLKFSRWLEEFPRRGGKLQVRPVTVANLEEIAADSDLTLVAAGKGVISGFFERDDERSEHRMPPRHVSAIALTGPKLLGARPWRRIPFRPLRFNFVAGVGEFFSLPFHTQATGEARSFLFEAIPGGPMDRFLEAESGADMLRIAREVIAAFAPDDLHHLDGAQLTDANAWLKGSFVPTVRKPVGHLPSGRLLMALGDTAVLNDPIAGQGANNATRMARHLAREIVARGGAPFDAAWMQSTFEEFWNSSAQYATAFSNALLKPPGAPVAEVLAAATVHPPVADAFVRGFDNPRNFWPWIADLEEARRFIEQKRRSA
ncbi:styrene monooxygenase/indole monooxygenase family protein [Azohydromonas caseinilytica]|uniref:FAD-binding oxidoreductase n=1 Tax=Azohydromonas caseinilytica TaxID=2728836 RepID=A0A848FIF9_9BURK|nr:styrene monooxygenase/indole monooxygenase family protein [Azohydromonas caseinilytica]NML18665.1 FAD-binding oxidoreductase [Azohydromonas caseinilytica]